MDEYIVNSKRKHHRSTLIALLKALIRHWTKDISKELSIIVVEIDIQDQTLLIKGKTHCITH